MAWYDRFRAPEIPTYKEEKPDPLPYLVTDIPEAIRMEGTHVVAPPGSGKTRLIAQQIAALIPEVLHQRASIVLMDSQEQLIDELSHLECWHVVKDRIVIIDANDVENPVALSLFDLGVAGATPLEKERMLNTALEVTMFMLDSLLGSDLTGKQSVVFRFLMQLIFEIPNATIYTLKELLTDQGYEKHRIHVFRLGRVAIDFFETEFRSKAFAQTRQEITRRLYGILAIRQWERMFNHPKNKLDLFAEMNSGKLILINTAKALLQPKGCEAFGRFFIALIAIAAQRRATAKSKVPVYVFIDEVQDYIGGSTADSNFLAILEQCRKQRIALTVAHQYLSQLSSRTLDTLQGVGVKYCSSLTDRDAHVMARGMKCKPELLENLARGVFACYARNLTPEATTTRVTFDSLGHVPRMTDAQYDAMRADMRKKYCAARDEPKAADEPIVNFTPRPEAMEPWRLSTADEDETKPSKKR